MKIHYGNHRYMVHGPIHMDLNTQKLLTMHVVVLRSKVVLRIFICDSPICSIYAETHTKLADLLSNMAQIFGIFHTKNYANPEENLITAWIDFRYKDSVPYGTGYWAWWILVSKHSAECTLEDFLSVIISRHSFQV